MKWFLIGLVLLLNSVALANFMTKEEVVKEFQKFSEKAVMEEKLTPEAELRLKSLKPADELVSKKDQKAMKESRAIRAKRHYEASGGVDRRNCDSVATSQCGGVCTSHGLTNAMDNLVCQPDKQISSNEDAWNMYREYSSDAAVEALLKKKICEDKDWPNCGKKKSSCDTNRHIKLVSVEKIYDSVDDAKKALDEGHPLNYAGKVTKSWANCDKVMNPNSATVNGGHAVAVVGYVDNEKVAGGGYFIILNSWGTDCGDKGYQYLPYKYCQRDDGGIYCYMHAITKVESNYTKTPVEPKPPIEPTPPVVPTPDCREVTYCERRWYSLWLKQYCWKETVCD